jgi:hypothetical protein
MLQRRHIHAGSVQDRTDDDSRNQVPQNRPQAEPRGQRNGNDPGKEQRESDEHELGGHGVSPILLSSAVLFRLDPCQARRKKPPLVYAPTLGSPLAQATP